METVLIVVAMTLIGLVSMLVTAQPAKRGRFGLPMSVVCVLGGTLAVLIYATNGTIGLDPLQAYAIGLIGVLPAFIGAQAGFLVGWLVWKRRQKRGPSTNDH